MSAPDPPLAVLASEAVVAAAVEAVAERAAAVLDDDAVVVCLLTGGLWFAADLTRALARRGRHPGFDALWLASYGDNRASGGAVELRAGLQRPVAGRTVLVVDDVLETGLSLSWARDHLVAARAARVFSAVFARKPGAAGRMEPDFVAWEAPSRFLVGYGMDMAGRYRGLGSVAALD